MRITTLGMLLAVMAACAPLNPIAITLTADGETRILATDARTVGEFLVEANITLDEDDRVTPSENTFLTNGMDVRVIRVRVEIETEEQIIPYGRETVRDATVPRGETRLLRAGVNGIRVITYAVTFEDGVVASRRVVREATQQEAENEVLLIGAQEEVVAVPITGTIAYLSDHNAWVMRATTGNRRRLTTSGDLDGRVFDLSPNGSWLLFTRASTETETLNTLWILDTVSASAEPAQLPADDILWAAWAPDGVYIAYSTGTARDISPGWEANNDLHLAIPRAQDGMLVGHRRILGVSSGGVLGWWGTYYAWRPGGAHMAYARADQVGTIRLFDGRMTPLASFAPYRTHGTWVWTPTPAWSPEGDFIATVIHSPSPSGEMPEDSPVFDLYALGVTEPLTAELSSEAGMWAAPSFSPDGTLVSFGRARIPYTSQTSSYDLYVMDRDGSSRRLLLPQEPGEPGLEYPGVVWDPWGSRLVAVYQENLYLVTIDGDARPITADGGITTVDWAGLAAGSAAE